MCNPGLVAVGTTAVTSIMSQQVQRAQAKGQDAAHDLNKTYAGEVRKRNISALETRLEQEREASGQRIADIDRAAKQYQGRNRAQAGSAGISGTTAQDIFQEVNRAAAQAVLRERTNLDNTTDQIFQEKLGVVDRQFSSILSVGQGTRPNPLAAFIQIGTAAAGAFANGDFDGIIGGGALIGGQAPSSDEQNDSEDSNE